MKKMCTLLLVVFAGCTTPQAVKDANLAQARIYSQVSGSLRKVLVETPPGSPALEEARAVALAHLTERDAQFNALSIYVGAYLEIPGCEEDVERVIGKVEEIIHEFRSPR